MYTKAAPLPLPLSPTPDTDVVLDLRSPQTDCFVCGKIAEL